MSNSIAPGSSADINVKVTALTTNQNVPVTYKTVILKKNLVNGVNILTQDMMSATNTKYVIKYDYVLGEDITVPDNCVLEFEGGSVSNGLLSGNNLKIIGNDTHLRDIYLDINNGNYCVINNIYFDYTFECMICDDAYYIVDIAVCRNENGLFNELTYLDL